MRTSIIWAVVINILVLALDVTRGGGGQLNNLMIGLNCSCIPCCLIRLGAC